ncbi:MAG: hypothetical protein WA005_14620 [Candidatus Binataceae bacterium]
MKCPNCRSEDLDTPATSTPVERTDLPLRHYHARCRACGNLLWWNAPVGVAEPDLRIGPHQCAFFRPPAAS